MKSGRQRKHAGDGHEQARSATRQSNRERTVAGYVAQDGDHQGAEAVARAQDVLRVVQLCQAADVHLNLELQDLGFYNPPKHGHPNKPHCMLKPQVYHIAATLRWQAWVHGCSGAAACV